MAIEVSCKCLMIVVVRKARSSKRVPQANSSKKETIRI